MKTRKYILLSVIVVWMVSSINAQWTTVTTFNSAARSLELFNNDLVIAGYFIERDGNTCYYSTAYDGNAFNDHSTDVTGSSGISQLEVFNNELFGAGSIFFGGATGVLKWTGTTWISDGFFTDSHAAIFADGNDLYVGSYSGIVSKKTGAGSYTGLPLLDGGSGKINAITKHNGAIIVGGNFNTYSGTSLNNIASWDGTSWQPVGPGFNTSVQCFETFNGELYAGGFISTVAGTTTFVEGIARWDGANWSRVGNSFMGSGTNGIRDMLVYNGKLYVVGSFTQIGGISAQAIACWDGTSWQNVGTGAPPFIDGKAIEVYKDKLYVVGGSNNNILYSLDVMVSTANFQDEYSMNTYPNPTSDVINIELKEYKPDLHLELTNSLGQIILQQSITDMNTSLDCSTLESGCYYLSIMDNSSGKQLVVKELSIVK